MTKVLASALAVLFLTGCSGAGPGLDALSSALAGLPIPSDAAVPAESFNGGTWTGTVSHEWTTHKVVTGADTKETTDEKYSAKTQVTSQDLGLDRWKLTGQGTVESSRSIVSDFTVGHCNNHFDDEASGSSAVVVPDGGIEIDGNHYNIRVEIPGITGSETSIRQTCPPQDPDTHEWEVADYTVLESGTLTDPNTISGSKTDDSGAKTTWDLHHAP